MTRAIREKIRGAEREDDGRCREHRQFMAFCRRNAGDRRNQIRIRTIENHRKIFAVSGGDELERRRLFAEITR